MSIPFIISAILFPVAGCVVDKLGNRITLLLFAGFMLFMTHIGFLIVNPLVPLITLGLSYTLFGAIVWPTVAVVVEESSLVSLIIDFPS